MNEQRVERIRDTLEQAFTPTELNISDDSHLHAGHAGARSGKGHFTVDIVSASFEGKSPIQRHRMVYAALAEMMETDIHALSVKASAPS